MKFAVVGAGAVGCYFGGMLARAGHEVVLVGRPQHVDAIVRDGLRIEARSFDERVRLAASTDIAAVAGAEVVLFCVKSTDTEDAAAQMKPHLRADALVLSLQNGVDNAQRAQALLRQPVAAAVVYVATEMAGPGHVRHHGRGELVLAPSARSEEVARVLCAADVPTEVSANAIGALWAKLVLNCAYNALSAITQLPYGQVVAGEGVAQVMQDVVRECLAVAKADGIELPGDLCQTVAGLAATMPTQYSSTAQDLARAKPNEIDHLNGFVLRRGAAHGIATPVNRTLHALVKLLAAHGRAAAAVKG